MRKSAAMKKIFLLCIFFLFIVTAVRSQTVSLNYNKTRLKTVLTSITEQTGYRAAYTDQMVDINKLVTIKITKTSLEKAMSQLLVETNLTFEIKDKTILIFEKKNESKKAPNGISKKITGLVTDQKGEPIVGAQLVVKGTNSGTITDRNGKFSIDVPNDASVIVSYIGYTKKEFSPTNKINYSIYLEESAQALDEVVVVGYGTIKKSDLTGSVTKLEAINTSEKGYSSMEQLLQGRASGVNISSNTGALGSGITFNIRGANSMGNNQPLIVIDGYPVESNNAAVSNKSGAEYWTNSVAESNVLSTLNPNEIESVEILKDASSTAIYGSRGANGVVLITTKRGKEGKDKFSYNYRTDIRQLPRKIDVLGSYDYMLFGNEARVNSGISTPAFIFPNDSIRYANVNTNWQDKIYQTGISHDHQLTFQGGDAKTRYFIIGGLSTMNGIVKNTDFNRASIRANIDRTFSTKFKMGLKFSTTFSDNRTAVQGINHTYIGSSIVNSALRFMPIVFDRLEDGNLDLSANMQSNPSLLIEKTFNKAKTLSIIANFYADYTISKTLSFRFNGGVNQTDNVYKSYQGRGTYVGDTYGGQAYQGVNNNLNYLTEYTLKYENRFNKHTINAVGGYTWQRWETTTNGITITGFPSDYLLANALQWGNVVNTPYSKLEDKSLASLLFRLNYTYDSKYLLTLTGRTDGSTVLATNYKWDFFPSIALGWNMHQESFLKNVKAIHQLKLRGSFGYSGNQSIAIGSTQALLMANRTVRPDGTIVMGSVLSSFENPYLGWERTSQLNFGTDISLLKGRYRITAEWYKKLTTDLLVGISIPQDNGFSGYMANSGKIENNGINVDISAEVLKGRFNWTISANFGVNKNTVVSIGDLPVIMGSNMLPGAMNQPVTMAKVGYPIGSFYGYRIIGVYQNADEVTQSPVDPSNPKPGDFKYDDISGPNGAPDGKITADDRTYLGSPDPDFSFGISNQFSYKSFSCSFFIQSNIGQKVANLNRYYSDALIFPAATISANNPSQAAWDGRWRGEGTSNYYPRAKTTGSNFENRFSDFLLEDASFIRLKDVSLSYTFPKKFIPLLQDLKVFVSGSNLITLTKYTGYDPEVSILGSSGLNRNVDYGAIPQNKIYSAGINITF